ASSWREPCIAQPPSRREPPRGAAARRWIAGAGPDAASASPWSPPPEPRSVSGGSPADARTPKVAGGRPTPGGLAAGHRLVQTAVERVEVPREPDVEPLGEPVGGVIEHAALVLLHDVPDLVEKLLVIVLVLGKPGVAVLAHELFLEREMRGDAVVELAEKRGDGLAAAARGAEPLVEAIDERDELDVLEIHRFDSGLEAVAPFDERH